MNRNENILNWAVYIIVTIIFICVAINGIDDLTGKYKIEQTIQNMKEIRIALEEYYQLTGRYPELSKEGVANDLTLLDYVNSDGEKISFAQIYGRKSLEKTLGNKGLYATNKVIDTDDFENKTNTGGWNYDYSGQTGEIYPNLPDDIYLEKINWNKQ